MSLRSLAALACVAPHAHSGVITVDDDAPADYRTLVEAVAAASSGDVILVQPGSYPSNKLIIDKDLAILGADVATTSLFLTEIEVTSDVTTFTLAGLRSFELDVNSVAGRVRIDDCDGRWATFDRCDQVLVTGSEFDPPGYDAVRVDESVVAIADSRLSGASDDELGWIGLSVDHPGSGGTAASEVLVSGTSVYGGWAHTGAFLPGIGGDAIWIGSFGGELNVVDVRGSSTDRIVAGEAFWDGESIYGPHTHSGVTLDPDVAEGLVDPPEPHLRLTGDTSLGGLSRVDVFGIAGQPAAVLFSAISSAPTEIPGWKGKLWMDLAGLVLVDFVALAGQDVGAGFDVPVPDFFPLLGFAVDVQGLVLMPSGALHLTNPEQLVPRE